MSLICPLSFGSFEFWGQKVTVFRQGAPEKFKRSKRYTVLYTCTALKTQINTDYLHVDYFMTWGL